MQMLKVAEVMAVFCLLSSLEGQTENLTTVHFKVSHTKEDIHLPLGLIIHLLVRILILRWPVIRLSSVFIRLSSLFILACANIVKLCQMVVFFICRIALGE